jgi:L-idonate 5-dehydrogenase
LITHTVSIDNAEDGFKLASDRTQAMKAQISFV